MPTTTANRGRSRSKAPRSASAASQQRKPHVRQTSRDPQAGAARRVSAPPRKSEVRRVLAAVAGGEVTSVVELAERAIKADLQLLQSLRQIIDRLLLSHPEAAEELSPELWGDEPSSEE